MAAKRREKRAGKKGGKMDSVSEGALFFRDWIRVIYGFGEIFSAFVHSVSVQIRSIYTHTKKKKLKYYKEFKRQLRRFQGFTVTQMNFVFAGLIRDYPKKKFFIGIQFGSRILPSYYHGVHCTLPMITSLYICYVKRSLLFIYFIYIYNYLIWCDSLYINYFCQMELLWLVSTHGPVRDPYFEKKIV